MKLCEPLKHSHSSVDSSYTPRCDYREAEGEASAANVFLAIKFSVGKRMSLDFDLNFSQTRQLAKQSRLGFGFGIGFFHVNY